MCFTDGFVELILRWTVSIQASSDRLVATPYDAETAGRAGMARLNVSLSTLDREIRDRHLVGTKVRGQWRFTEEQVAG